MGTISSTVFLYHRSSRWVSEERRKSSALAAELRLSYTNPSIYGITVSNPGLLAIFIGLLIFISTLQYHFLALATLFGPLYIAVTFLTTLRHVSALVLFRGRVAPL